MIQTIFTVEVCFIWMKINDDYYYYHHNTIFEDLELVSDDEAAS